MSCGSSHNDVPDNIIEPDTLTLVLTEMHLAEASLIHLQQKGENAAQEKKHLYDLIFDKHHISKSQLDSSINWYSTQNIKQLEDVYANVITNLSRKQSEEKVK